MVFFGGYRYQIDPRITTTTRPIRTDRFLRIPLALALRDPADRPAIELQLHLIGHPERHRVLVEIQHGAVQPARGDDPIALPDGGEHGLAITLLLLLGANEQEVEDREDRAEKYHLHVHSAGPARAARGKGRGKGQIGSVGDV